MKTELQVFNYNSNEVRTIQKDGEPWFVLKDVCQVLGLSDTNKTAERLDHDELTRTKLVSGGQEREMYIINESGLYNVILRSDKPEAKPFRKWVTSEVLPSIRKTGGYSIKPMTDYQQKMIETRERNSRIQASRILTQLAKQYQGTTYEQVLNAHATKELTGEYLLPIPALEKKTYSAGEIGDILGISANKVGMLANHNGLKTDEYGQWFKDKAKWSNKEVPTFRYYENSIPVFQNLMKTLKEKHLN